MVRGGLGIFTGRVPFVWMLNAYNNNGVELKHYYVSRNTVPTVGETINDLKGATETLSASSEVINTTAKNFRFPQVLRANLAVEQNLPGDVKMTLEGVYSKNLNQAYFENLALVNKGSVYAVPGVEASVAPYYEKMKSNYSQIINIRNTNKGYSYALTAALQKSFNFGLDVNATYTFGHSKSVNDCTSSIASSNWQYNYSVDTNNEKEIGWSKFDIPHRVMVALNYTSPKYLNGLMSTSFSIIYNGTSGEDRQKFGEWIEADKYAKNHRGEYAVRNSNRTPWENEVNLHFGQSFYAKNIGKLEFTVDITNFANMLNKKWGTQYGNAYNVSPITVDAVSTAAGADGKVVTTPTYSYNANSNPNAAPVLSRWHCQVGLRLTF